MSTNLALGMAALESAAAGGQANLAPEVAQALLQEFSDLRGLCGWAADDLPKVLRALTAVEQRDCDELLAELLEAARAGENAELRKLCGRAAKCVPRVGRGVTMISALEAAARRAGK